LRTRTTRLWADSHFNASRSKERLFHARMIEFIDMPHWIVTHNPHLIPDPHGWNIYFRKLPRKIPFIGDSVLFYETETTFESRDRPGEKAIVRVASVCGIPGPVSGIGQWVHQIPCKTIRECFLPLADARKIIKQPFYRRNLTEVSEAMFHQIERAAADRVPGQAPRN
jgi:hypothetical protein